MAFSHKANAERALATQIRRAKTMALSATNPTFKIQHPDWVRDAQKKDFTLLTKVVTESVTKMQKLARTRRERLHGQN